MSKQPQLSSQEFERVFPFYLALDDELRLVSWGAAMERVCSELVAGDVWTKHFYLQRPLLGEPGIQGLEKLQESPFLLLHRKSGITLRGQMLVQFGQPRAMFLGMPWVTSLDELQEKGIHVRDFPVHTPLADLLFVIQGQRRSLQEAHEAAARLLKSQQVLARAKKDAEAASVAKDAFLANISHEIRTPLNGIMGVTRLLRESLQGVEQMEYADLIECSSHALLRVFEDVLELSQIRSGKLELNAGPFDLPDFLQEILHMYSGAARAKGVGLRLVTPSDLPRSIHADSARLRQVLNSLVGNAIKFTSSGEVIIEAAVEDEGEAGESVLDLRVTDSGVGIPKESLQRIFDAFVQVDETTTRRFGGTGLGLAICRRLVNLMAGTIQAESLEGHGATFRVRIPTRILEPYGAPDNSGIDLDAVPSPCELIENESAQADLEGHQDVTHQAHDSPGPIHRKSPEEARLLLVEDSAVNQLVAKRLLTKLGYRVDCASDGSEAVARFRSQSYDLILMDLQMPNMDGYAASNSIRSLEGEGERVPIIALTANALPEHRARCLANGMDDFVPKPFDFEALAETISGWINLDTQRQSRRA